MGSHVSAALRPFDLTALLRQMVHDVGSHAPGQNWRRAAGKKQSSGVLVDIAGLARGGGGGKQSFGFGVDVINILRELSARVDKLAERNGVSPRELGVAAALQDAFTGARASGLDRETLSRLVQEELERAFKGK